MIHELMPVLHVADVAHRLHTSSTAKVYRMASSNSAGESDYNRRQNFLLHPIRVSLHVCSYAANHEETKLWGTIALLHDVAKETTYPMEKIHQQFGKDVYQGIMYLTRHDMDQGAPGDQSELYLHNLEQAPDYIRLIQVHRLRATAPALADQLKMICEKLMKDGHFNVDCFDPAHGFWPPK